MSDPESLYQEAIRCQWTSTQSEWWGNSDMFCPSEATHLYHGVNLCSMHKLRLKDKLRRARKVGQHKVDKIMKRFNYSANQESTKVNPCNNCITPNLCRDLGRWDYCKEKI